MDCCGEEISTGALGLFEVGADWTATSRRSTSYIQLSSSSPQSSTSLERESCLMLLRSRCLYAPAYRASSKCLTSAQRASRYGCASTVRRGSNPWTYRSGDKIQTWRSYATNTHNIAGSKKAKSSPLEEFKQHLAFPKATSTIAELAGRTSKLVDTDIVLHGYVGARRDASKSLTFAELHDESLRRTVQLVCSAGKGTVNSDSTHQLLRSLEDHAPVAVAGTIKTRVPPRDGNVQPSDQVKVTDVEIVVNNITPLNEFPKDIIMAPETVFSPEQRHLQIRNDWSIRGALSFRSKAAQLIRNELCEQQDFLEIETPMLFKSTPEGAREFLVPTRNPGMAYALPQSPQQYKQILMASGIPRYMQIARCFRDEDLRADRQPEFTQVDLEMAFAFGEDVMSSVEKLIKRLWSSSLGVDFAEPFGRITYDQAMARYGSDKPDMRFASELRRIEYMLPVDLVSKIGPLSDPIVEVMKVSIAEDPKETMKFVSDFMESPTALPFTQNPEGQPGMFIFDSRKPLQGLQPFGFEAAEQVEEMLELEDGDLVVLQARKNSPFSGGSTPIGNLRLALHKAAIKSGFAPPDEGFKLIWVTDFPLFSPNNDSDPGQGGSAGISSTHHPFTSPKTAADVDLLATAPLKVQADHYDLVCNGVELGGGSRRIHSAAMQEYIMRDVLKMSNERMKDFAHLLEVLRAGCPPHAGFALGFDRLVAVMLGKDSVRDVIAFPKSGKGEDLLVKSPSRMTESQMETYHLRLRE